MEVPKTMETSSAIAHQLVSGLHPEVKVPSVWHTVLHLNCLIEWNHLIQRDLTLDEHMYLMPQHVKELFLLPMTKVQTSTPLSMIRQEASDINSNHHLPYVLHPTTSVSEKQMLKSTSFQLSH